MPLTRVLLEPVRSAEPPIISGTAGGRALRAHVRDALRVAISFGARRERCLDLRRRPRRAPWLAVRPSCGARIRARTPASLPQTSCVQLRASPCAARSGRAPCVENVRAGFRTARSPSPGSCARLRFRRRRAASRATFRSRPCSARRSRWWSCTRSVLGRSDFCARVDRAAIAVGS